MKMSGLTIFVEKDVVWLDIAMENHFTVHDVNGC